MRRRVDEVEALAPPLAPATEAVLESPPTATAAGGAAAADVDTAERTVAPAEGNEVEQVIAAEELQALVNSRIDNAPKVWINATPTGRYELLGASSRSYTDHDCVL